MLHSEAAWTNKKTNQSGGGNVNEYKIVVGSEKHYSKKKYNHRFYQWDTPEEGEASKKAKESEPEKNNYMSWQEVTNLVMDWVGVNPSIRLKVN